MTITIYLGEFVPALAAAPSAIEGVEVECHDGQIVITLDRDRRSERLLFDVDAAEDMAFSVLHLVANCRNGWAMAPT